MHPSTERPVSRFGIECHNPIGKARYNGTSRSIPCAPTFAMQNYSRIVRGSDCFEEVDLFDECGPDSATGAAPPIAAAHLGALGGLVESNCRP